MQNLILDGKSLRVEDVHNAATSRTTISIAPSAKKAIQSSRNLVEEWVKKGEVVYGVTTGFGDLRHALMAVPTARDTQSRVSNPT